MASHNRYSKRPNGGELRSSAARPGAEFWNGFVIGYGVGLSGGPATAKMSGELSAFNVEGGSVLPGHLIAESSIASEALPVQFNFHSAAGASATDHSRSIEQPLSVMDGIAREVFGEAFKGVQVDIEHDDELGQERVEAEFLIGGIERPAFRRLRQEFVRQLSRAIDPEDLIRLVISVTRDA